MKITIVMQINDSIKIFFTKLKHIVVGWYYVFVGKNHKLLQERMKVCNNCIEKIRITKSVYMCNICGCFLHAKNRVKDEECPLKKWKWV